MRCPSSVDARAVLAHMVFVQMLCQDLKHGRCFECSGIPYTLGLVSLVVLFTSSSS
jgi:hypothetical protein